MEQELFHAVHINWTDQVHQLLSTSLSNVNVNARDEHGNTPLHIASLNRNVKIATFLLNMGANIDSRNDRGFTPLGMALCGCRARAKKSVKLEVHNMLEFLIKCGANPNACDSLLHFAVRKYISNAIKSSSIRLLIKAGANVKAKNSDGLSACDVAIKESNSSKLVDIFTFTTSIREQPLRESEHVSHLQVHQIESNLRPNVENGWLNSSAPMNPEHCCPCGLQLNPEYCCPCGLQLRESRLTREESYTENDEGIEISDDICCGNERDDETDNLWSGDFILNHFECLICLEPFNGNENIIQCQNGHLFCEPCHTYIDDCPICRADLKDLTIRNRALEELIRKIRERLNSFP